MKTKSAPFGNPFTQIHQTNQSMSKQIKTNTDGPRVLEEIHVGVEAQEGGEAVLDLSLFNCVG